MTQRARAVVLAVLLAAGCVSSGRDFPATAVPDLEPGTTTQADVRARFGDPWRTGLEDGRRTWTYGHYRYTLFGDDLARDLKLEFDERGVLTTDTYSSTERDLP